jgi:hypothetical protein
MTSDRYGQGVGTGTPIVNRRCELAPSSHEGSDASLLVTRPFDPAHRFRYRPEARPYPHNTTEPPTEREADHFRAFISILSSNPPGFRHVRKVGRSGRLEPPVAVCRECADYAACIGSIPFLWTGMLPAQWLALRALRQAAISAIPMLPSPDYSRIGRPQRANADGAETSVASRDLAVSWCVR